jgi:hypothetical protein
VRGFAFYLGVATILDLVSAYFFMRPGVMVLSRSSQGEHPRRFGIPVDDLTGHALSGAGREPAVAGAGASPSVTPATGEGA